MKDMKPYVAQMLPQDAMVELELHDEEEMLRCRLQPLPKQGDSSEALAQCGERPRGVIRCSARFWLKFSAPPFGVIVLVT